MSITINETIACLIDKAERLSKLEHLDDAQYDYYQEQIAYCKQIADWLNELKGYRNGAH